MAVSNSTDRFNGVVASKAVKVPCKVATSANISLSGAQTIDGVSVVTGDRVLVRAQTDPIENGIYDVDSSSAWQRAADWDGNRDIVRGTTIVAFDSLSNPTTYILTTPDPIQIGTTAVTIDALAGGGGALVESGTITNAMLRWDGIDTYRETDRIRATADGAELRIYETTLTDYMQVTYTGSSAIFALSNGSHNFEFQSDVVISGSDLVMTTGDVSLADNGTARFGSGDDVAISWDGSQLIFQPAVNTGTNVALRDGMLLVIYSDDDLEFGLFNVFGDDFIWQGSNINWFQMSNFRGLQLGLVSQSDQPMLSILESAAAAADEAGYGQIWVRNDSPNVLMFTDDAGTDFEISTGITPPIDLNDNEEIRFGTAQDVLMDFDGTNFVINASVTGTDLNVDGFSGNLRARSGVGFAINTDDNISTSLLITGGATAADAVTFGTTLRFNFEDHIRSQAGISTLGTTQNTGLNEQVSFIDVSGGIGRFGSYNWSLAAWQPASINGSTMEVHARDASGTISFQTGGTQRMLIDAANGRFVFNSYPLFVQERATAAADFVGYGQLWVDNVGGDLYFTGDDGVDHQISGVAAGNVSSTGTPVNNQVAVWTNANTIEGDPNLTWTGAALVIDDAALLDLGSTTGDRIQVFGASYTIGIEANTLYFNTNAEFDWYEGGAGGTPMMTLTQLNGGTLTVRSTITVTLGNITASAGDVRALAGSMATGAADGDGYWLEQTVGGSYGMYLSDISDVTYGGRMVGDTTSDLNTYFTTDNGVNRGFVFKTNGPGNAAADMQFAIHPDGIRARPSIYMLEKAAADLDDAGMGQLWVRNDTPNTPMFTGDTGVDSRIARLALDQTFGPSDVERTLGLTSGPWTGAADNYLALRSTTDLDNVELHLEVAEGVSNRRARFFLSDENGEFGLQGSASVGVPGFGVYIGVNRQLHIDPSATQFTVGNYVFNMDQTVGVGQDNFVLTYDNGTGEIGLEAAAGGGGNVSNTGTPVDNQLAVWTNSTTIEGDANLTWTGSNLSVGGDVTIGGTGSLVLVDSREIRFGNGTDMVVDFDGTASYLIFNNAAAANGIRFQDVSVTKIEMDMTNGRFILNDGFAMFVEESASPPSTVAAYGSIWVDDTAPNRFGFHDDGGSDAFLGALGLQIVESASRPYTAPGAGNSQLWAKNLAPTVMFFQSDLDQAFSIANVGNDLLYTFDTSTTSADPGQGDLRYNSATPGSITEIYVDALDEEGHPHSDKWGDLERGDIVEVFAMQSEARRQRFRVNGAVTDNTGWYTVPVEPINSGTLHTSQEPLAVVFHKADRILQDYSIENDNQGAVADGNVTLTYADGPVFELDLENWSINRTITLSGGPATGKYGQMTVKITQDGTAARTITWAGGTFVWAGGTAHPLNSTLNGISIYTFETWDGGTTWYGAGADYS